MNIRKTSAVLILVSLILILYLWHGFNKQDNASDNDSGFDEDVCGERNNFPGISESMMADILKHQISITGNPDAAVTIIEYSGLYDLHG